MLKLDFLNDKPSTFGGSAIAAAAHGGDAEHDELLAEDVTKFALPPHVSNVRNNGERVVLSVHLRGGVALPLPCRVVCDSRRRTVRST